MSPIKPVLPDYRDQFLGTYFCKKISSSLSNDAKGSVSKTDTLSIKISKDVVDSVLVINLKEGRLKFKLVGKSIRSEPLTGMQIGGKFFAGDSLDLYFSPNHAFAYRYIGKKI